MFYVQRNSKSIGMKIISKKIVFKKNPHFLYLNFGHNHYKLIYRVQNLRHELMGALTAACVYILFTLLLYIVGSLLIRIVNSILYYLPDTRTRNRRIRNRQNAILTQTGKYSYGEMSRMHGWTWVVAG